MAITIKVNGYDVSVSSPTEAAELLRALENPNASASRDTTTSAPLPAQQKAAAASFTPANGLFPELNLQAAGTTLLFLKAIRDGGQKGGIEATALMNIFGVSAPKAIGSKSATVNKILNGMGLKHRTVYQNPKTPNGRLWKPGRNMTQAIQLLEERLAAH